MGGLSRGVMLDTTEGAREYYSDEEDYSEDYSEDHSEEESDNPLFRKFLRDGPLNPMAHERWNPKTGGVDPDPLLLRDERRRRQQVMKRQREEEELVRTRREAEARALQGGGGRGRGDKEVAESILNLWQGGASGMFSSHSRSPPQSAAMSLSLSLATPPCEEQLSLPSLGSGNSSSVMRPPFSPGQQSDYSTCSSPGCSQSRGSQSRGRVGASRTSTGRSSPTRSREQRQRRSPGRRSPQKKRGKGSSVLSLLSADDRDGKSRGSYSDKSSFSSQSAGDAAFEASQRYFFNELFHKASQIDRIRNPLPMLHNKTQDELDRITAQDDERRLRLIEHCNELA